MTLKLNLTLAQERNVLKERNAALLAEVETLTAERDALRTRVAALEEALRDSAIYAHIPHNGESFVDRPFTECRRPICRRWTRLLAASPPAATELEGIR